MYDTPARLQGKGDKTCKLNWRKKQPAAVVPPWEIVQLAAIQAL